MHPRALLRPLARVVVLTLLATVMGWVAPRIVLREEMTVDRERAVVHAWSGIEAAGAAEVGPDHHAEDGHDHAEGDDADRVRTEAVLTRPFTTLGVALDARPDGPVRVRWRSGGTWSAWTEAEVEDDEGPDLDSPEHHDDVVTQPLWVGEADGYQVDAPDAAVGSSVDALLVRRQQVAVAATEVEAGASLNAPGIRTRSSWGARSPSSPPTYDDQLRLVVVHHSATANGYAESEVPSILRSIQAFHMDGRGWNDIAYNFVVDRTGRIWEGRGESDRLARGAHAQGFNTDTVGVMVLGEYGSVAPTDLQLDAVARIISWKFANERVDPRSTVDYVSGGSPTIAAGRTVTLPRIIGHSDVGSTSCPGSQLYRVLWAVRARVLDQEVGARSPAGEVDPLSFAPGRLLVSGWVADPDTSSPVDVHVYLDGRGFNLGPADRPRPEVAAAHRRLGSAHGFSWTATGVPPGRHQACVYAINVSVGANALVGCRDIDVPTGDPLGQLGATVGRPDGGIAVDGWAVDPDTDDPVPVHLYIDGRGVNLGPTDAPSAAAVAQLPLYGDRRGFSYAGTGWSVGPHTVCAYAINLGPGANRLLGCRTVVVPGGSPFGSVDVATGSPGGRVSVRGWVIDPDTASPTDVHLYVGSRGVNLGVAGAARPDVAAAYPGYGADHGFGATIEGIPPGTHQACLFGINRGTGENRLLGCRSVSVPGGPPFGTLDAAVPVGGGALYVAGWVIDPDVVGPADVHVYVGPVGRNLGPATAGRADVGAAYAAYGPDHGYSARLEGLPVGTWQVCAYGINQGAGGNSLLGCRSATVG